MNRQKDIDQGVFLVELSVFSFNATSILLDQMFRISCSIRELSSVYLQLQSSGQANPGAMLQPELVIQDQRQSALLTKRSGSLVWQVTQLRLPIYLQLQ